MALSANIIYLFLNKIICVSILLNILAEHAHASAFAVQTRCRNPNEHLGSCVSIYECESLLYILRNRLKKDYNFLRMSQCQSDDEASGKDPYVCCTSDLRFTERQSDRIIFPSGRPNGVEISVPKVNKNSGSILPKAPNCGAVAITQKIYGGLEADLTEFPWMVNLEYRTATGSLVTVCAGSLINDRYVLTAAHCIKGKIEQKVGQLVSVRLGAHNIHTVVVCNEFFCNAPFRRVGIESISIHAEYNHDTNLGMHLHNDIALIRLDRTINYTNSIQPICLPIGATEELYNGIKLTVAGWGHNGTVKHTDEKRKVTVPVVDHEICRQWYSELIYVADEQLCAGGIYRQDSCTGDSGGPLMRLAAGSWFLEGIVSFGRGCGLEQPGIYSNVRSYISWIVATLRP